MTPELKELLFTRTTVSPRELLEHRILGRISRSALYVALQKGDVEAIRVGPKLYEIPTSYLRRRLGLN